MAHARVENNSGGFLQQLFTLNGDGYPICGLILKYSAKIAHGTDAQLTEPQPVDFSGKHYGSPENSSYKYEPETAYTKPTTDVVLIGNAYPNQRNQTNLDVRVRVGSEIDKSVRVFGNRTWVSRFGMIEKSEPQIIEQPVPLIYERAFGGWDSAEPDPMSSKFEGRNPVGVGFKRRRFEENLPLPNLEDPARPLLMYGDTPPPAAFGFVSPNWAPRTTLAGSYGKQWEESRAPLLPVDFDERYFNAASHGMITRQYLLGNETVFIENATATGRLSFKLPSIRAPQIRVGLRGLPDSRLQPNLDTVIINTEDMSVSLLWRTHLILRSGPHDVLAIVVP